MANQRLYSAQDVLHAGRALEDRGAEVTAETLHAALGGQGRKETAWSTWARLAEQGELRRDRLRHVTDAFAALPEAQQDCLLSAATNALRLLALRDATATALFEDEEHRNRRNTAGLQDALGAKTEEAESLKQRVAELEARLRDAQQPPSALPAPAGLIGGKGWIPDVRGPL